MNDLMLRPDEAARRLGVTTRCLYQWVRQGKIAPPIKLTSHTTVFRASNLEAFVAEREKAGSL